MTMVGVVNGGSPERMTRCLERLLHAAPDDPGQPCSRVVRGRVALAVTDRFSVPARLAAGAGVLLGVYGHIFEPEVANRLGQPDPDALLARFLARGAADLQGLNGDYLVAVWEDTPRRLTVINDRFGLRSLYYWATGHRLVLAPTLSAFAALPEFPQTLDEVALADYLSVGHHLDGRTWYAAVRLLPPASVLTFANGHLSLRNYWQFEPHRPSRPLGFEEWTARHLHALEGAVRRRLLAAETSTDVGVEDSAGAATLEALLAKTRGHVWRLSAAPDPAQTGALPARVGLRISDGSRPCHAARLARLAAGLGQVRTTLFSDHLGSIFGIPLRPSPDPSRVTCSRVFGDGELRQILRAEVYRVVVGATTDALARSYAEAPGESPEAKATSVFLRQHQHHHSPFHLEQVAEECGVSAPFADPEVVEVARTPVDHGSTRDAASPATVGVPAAGCGCQSPPARDLVLEGIGRLLDADDPLPGEFFRIPRLREVVRGHLEAGDLQREKLCVLGGIGLWLAGFRHDEPRPEDLALTKLAAGHPQAQGEIG